MKRRLNSNANRMMIIVGVTIWECENLFNHGIIISVGHGNEEMKGISYFTMRWIIICVLFSQASGLCHLNRKSISNCFNWTNKGILKFAPVWLNIRDYFWHCLHSNLRENIANEKVKWKTIEASRTLGSFTDFTLKKLLNKWCSWWSAFDPERR